MKMRIGALAFKIVLAMILGSCSNEEVESVDQLLMEKKWYLYSVKSTINYSTSKTVMHDSIFKKSDSVAVYDFRPDSVLLITGVKQKMLESRRWYWKTTEYERAITCEKDTNTYDLNILELSGNEFSVFTYTIEDDGILELTFKHLDDPDWLDDDVNFMNRVLNE